MIVLQIYLVKKKNKWLGLILPLITFSISLMAVLGVVTFYQVSSTHVKSQTVTTDGVITQQIMEQPVEQDTSEVMEHVFVASYILVFYNIPTVILLLIYKNGRKKLKEAIELEK